MRKKRKCSDKSQWSDDFLSAFVNESFSIGTGNGWKAFENAKRKVGDNLSPESNPYDQWWRGK